MRYVLDSSVGFKWVVAEPLQDKARRLREDFRKAAHELIAPDVFLIEVAHALTRAERQGRITPAESRLFLTDVVTEPPQLLPSLPLLQRAHELSSANRVGVYDCLYVALAEREGCQFVTADDRLVRVLSAQFPFIVALAALP
jgi:predicted nucleic acid-binding protein